MLGTMLVALSGCSAFSVRPDSPAKDIPPGSLDDPEPGSRFFAIVFGSQSVPKLLWKTHTWATVIKTNDAPCPAALQVLEHHTISWMPVTTQLRLFALSPEPAKNHGLAETITLMQKGGQRVSEWGPYEVRPRGFRRFLVQKQFLDSGVIGYQGMDNIGEAAHKGNGCDCVHAITDMDPLFDRGTYPLLRLGDAASRFVVKQFMNRGVVVNPDKTYPELNAQLGLSEFSIVQRTYPG
jgi:hypothetical protein